MAIFLSAGHNPKGRRRDPGAVANGYQEADLAVELRDLVISEINNQHPTAKIIRDYDHERLGSYLRRIKTGTGSVVLEFHFDASSSSTASGSTAFYSFRANKLSRDFATALASATSRILGIKNRGAKSERHTHRGRLGLMRKRGTVALLEVCFITNPNDMRLYHSKKGELAKELASIVHHYETLAS